MQYTEDLSWVKLYRRSIKSRVFKNEGLWKVWTWCLMRSNFEKTWVSLKTGKGFVEVCVDPGQFIFGRKSAADELNMPESTVWKRITKLKNMQNLNIESNRQYSIITILNWETYQQQKPKGNSKGNRQGTGKEQARNTDKNDKNVKNDKNNTLSISESIYKIYLEKINPQQKTKKRAIINIDHYLKTNSESDLIKSIENYSTITDSRERKYRKNPANFFGKQEPAFLDFLPGAFKPDQKDDIVAPIPTTYAQHQDAEQRAMTDAALKYQRMKDEAKSRRSESGTGGIKQLLPPTEGG